MNSFGTDGAVALSYVFLKTFPAVTSRCFIHSKGHKGSSQLKLGLKIKTAGID